MPSGRYERARRRPRTQRLGRVARTADGAPAGRRDRPASSSSFGWAKPVVRALARVAHAWRALVCVVRGHALDVIERRYPETHRSTLLGALVHCRRCGIVIDWREPSAGPRTRSSSP